MHGPLPRQLLVSAIWSLVGVVVGGRNQIGKAHIHVPTLTAYSPRQCQGHGQTQRPWRLPTAEEWHWWWSD